MDMPTYQRNANRTARFVGTSKEGDLLYATLGIAGEVGELVNKVKKIIRDDGGVLTKVKAQEIELEAGDVLWYLSQVARLSGSSLEKVAQRNIAKLAARDKKGTIHGSGDHR